MIDSYDHLMGTPQDVEDHPAYNKSDATQHYAGDVVPFPIPMIQSDLNRLSSTVAIKQGKMNTSNPAKVLMGPGANK